MDPGRLGARGALGYPFAAASLAFAGGGRPPSGATIQSWVCQASGGAISSACARATPWRDF
eukprot:6886902-Lingulodinium_polyedra.AAC.1